MQVRVRRHVVAVPRSGAGRDRDHVCRRICGAAASAVAATTTATRWCAQRLALGRGVEPGENARARDDDRLLWMIDRHLDDVELKQGVRDIGGIRSVLASGKLGVRPRRLLSRYI